MKTRREYQQQTKFYQATQVGIIYVKVEQKQ